MTFRDSCRRTLSGCNLWRPSSSSGGGGGKHRQVSDPQRHQQQKVEESSKSTTHVQKAGQELEDDTETSEASCDFFCSSASHNNSLLRDLYDAQSNTDCTEIVLHNGIMSDDAAFLSLLEALHSDNRPWEVLRLVETVSGASYNSWLSRKQARLPSLMNILKSRNISLELDCTLEVDLNNKATSQISDVTKLFQRVEDDRDILCLSVTGAIKHKLIEPLSDALIDLLCYDDRPWQEVRVKVSFRGNRTDQFPRWERQLESSRKTLLSFSKEYGIQIDLL